MGGKKVSNENIVIKCIKTPYRILCRARDMYVRSMIDCAGTSAYGGTIPNLPKSYSTRSSTSSSRMSDINDEDFKELIRAASQRGLKNKININSEEIRRFSTPTTKSINHKSNSTSPLPRSFTVGIGRIDEDKALDFDEDIKVSNESFYPRSRSYAVSSKRPTSFLS